MKRASYKAGIDWIAWNDEQCETDVNVIAYQISVLLLADLFGKKPEKVAADIIRKRSSRIA